MMTVRKWRKKPYAIQKFGTHIMSDHVFWMSSSFWSIPEQWLARLAKKYWSQHLLPSLGWSQSRNPPYFPVSLSLSLNIFEKIMPLQKCCFGDLKKLLPKFWTFKYLKKWKQVSGYFESSQILTKSHIG